MGWMGPGMCAVGWVVMGGCVMADVARDGVVQGGEELGSAEELERRAARVGVLEGRIREGALADARCAVLRRVARERGVVLDVERAAGLLSRLTDDVAAVVDEEGRGVVPEEGLRVMWERAVELADWVAGGRPAAPPISPGEPPVVSRGGAGRAGRMADGAGCGNCWEGGPRRGGAARGRELIECAAREMEREGLL